MITESKWQRKGIDEKGRTVYECDIPKSVINRCAKEDRQIYLSDFIEGGVIPTGCIFVKSVPGCGATTMILNQTDRNMIVAFPMVNLCISKVAEKDPLSHEITKWLDNEIDGDMLCVYSSHNDKPEAILRYIKRIQAQDGKFCKIVCTYDQVYKIIQTMKDNGFSPEVGRWYLYIDEIHQVVFSYNGQRKQHLKQMLACVEEFGNRCTAITATPLKAHQWYKELPKEIRKVNYPVELMRRFTEVSLHTNLLTDVRDEVLAYLDGRREGAHGYFFVNSVRFIRDILSKPMIEKYGSQIRVICSNQDINEQILRQVTNKALERAAKDYIAGMEQGEQIFLQACRETRELRDMPIASVNSAPTKVTFLTSTAFCGVDLFDPHGVTYLISDPRNANTLHDISTIVVQVLGRIRDTRNHTAYHWIATGGTRYLSDDGTQSTYETEKQTILGWANQILEMSDVGGTGRNYAWEQYQKDLEEGNSRMENLHLSPKIDGTQEMEYDPLLELKDEIAHDVVTNQYTIAANIPAKLIQQGIKAEYKGLVTHSKDEVSERDIINQPHKKATFKQCFLLYCEHREGTRIFFNEDERYIFIRTAEKRYPFIRDAYDKLGKKRVAELHYRTDTVQKAVEDMSVQDYQSEIYRAFGLKIGDLVTPARAKELCERIAQKFPELAGKKKLKFSTFFEYDPWQMWDKEEKKTKKAYKIKSKIWKPT